MKAICADMGFKFEAYGFTLSIVTMFSAIHGKYFTHVFAMQGSKIKHKSKRMFHEELSPGEYDVKKATELIYIQIRKETKC